MGSPIRLAPSTERLYASLKNRKLTPRAAMALRLWVTNAVPTKAAAADAAGVSRGSFYHLTNPAAGSEHAKRFVNEMSSMINDETVAESVIIRKLGRKAIARIAELMDHPNEHVALKAAVDLADRSPATAKTTKLEVDSFTLSGQDAKELAAALVEASQRSQMYDQVSTKGLVEISDLPKPLPKEGTEPGG